MSDDVESSQQQKQQFENDDVSQQTKVPESSQEQVTSASSTTDDAQAPSAHVSSAQEGESKVPSEQQVNGDTLKESKEQNSKLPGASQEKPDGILSWFSSIIEPSKPPTFPKATEPGGHSGKKTSPETAQPDANNTEPETDDTTHEEDVVSGIDSENNTEPELPEDSQTTQNSQIMASQNSSPLIMSQSNSTNDQLEDTKANDLPPLERRDIPRLEKLQKSESTSSNFSSSSPSTPKDNSSSIRHDGDTAETMLPVEVIKRKTRHSKSSKRKSKKSRRKRRVSVTSNRSAQDEPVASTPDGFDSLLTIDDAQSSMGRKKSTDSTSTSSSQPQQTAKEEEGFFNSLFRKKEISNLGSNASPGSVGSGGTGNDENSNIESLAPEISLKAEWSQAEISNEEFSAQINEVKSERDHLNKKVNKALSIIKELNDKIEDRETVLTKQDQQIISLSEENDRLKTENEEITSENSELKQSLRDMEEGYELDRNIMGDTIAGLEQKLYASRQARDKLNAAERNYQKVIEDLQHQLALVEKGLEQAEKQAREISKNGSGLYLPALPLIEADEEDEERLLLTFQEFTFIPRDIAKLKGGSVTVLDLSGNRIKSGVNLEVFTSLRTLILDRNEIDRLVEYPVCETIDTLWLNNNKIRDLPGLLDTLRESFPNLTYLSLLQNPCCPLLREGENMDKEAEHRYNDYRLWILRKVPKLKILDTRPIVDQERRDTMF